MNEQIKLSFALMQIENLTSLLKGNEYEKFLYSHLISIQIELQRQLSFLDKSHTFY
jgi:hypothetical protein